MIEETPVTPERFKALENLIREQMWEESFIPEGAPHSGESLPGTRTIHTFGGKRA